MQLGKFSINYPHHKAPLATPVIGAFLFQSLYALIEARILTVADVVEAMASHRPYRPGLGIDAALAEIEKNKGIFYDKAVAEACLRLFREKGFKLEVIDYNNR